MASGELSHEGSGTRIGEPKAKIIPLALLHRKPLRFHKLMLIHLRGGDLSHADGAGMPCSATEIDASKVYAVLLDELRKALRGARVMGH